MRAGTMQHDSAGKLDSLAGTSCTTLHINSLQYHVCQECCTGSLQLGSMQSGGPSCKTLHPQLMWAMKLCVPGNAPKAYMQHM